MQQNRLVIHFCDHSTWKHTQADQSLVMLRTRRREAAGSHTWSCVLNASTDHSIMSDLHLQSPISQLPCLSHKNTVLSISQTMAVLSFHSLAMHVWQLQKSHGCTAESKGGNSPCNHMLGICPTELSPMNETEGAAEAQLMHNTCNQIGPSITVLVLH